MNIKKNIIYQITYQIIMPLLSFILSPYLARAIGAEGIGVYSYSYNIAYFFVLFSGKSISNIDTMTIVTAIDLVQPV